MTDGEKMIWAAAFARNYTPEIPPPHVVRESQMGRELWELQLAAAAAECAWAAVLGAREAVGEVANGWGDDSDTYAMIVEMVGDGDSGE